MQNEQTQQEQHQDENQNPNGAGRKWFDGKIEEVVLSDLKRVWGLGGTDGEAARYAGISTSALSRYIRAFPHVAELRDKLKDQPILKARGTVVHKLDEVETARWYLERKRKDEFSTKTEVDESHKFDPNEPLVIIRATAQQPDAKPADKLEDHGDQAPTETGTISL